MLKLYKFSQNLNPERTEPFFGSRAAGLFLICQEDNTAFLLKRSSYVNEPGTWGIPGGKVEEGEDLKEAAIREVNEEVGGLPSLGKLLDTLTYKEEDFTFTTFVYSISLEEKKRWSPVLNWESTEFRWFPLSALPSNLHFGVKFIKKLQQEAGIIPKLQSEYDWVIEELNKINLPIDIHATIVDKLLSTPPREVNLKEILKPAIKYAVVNKDFSTFRKFKYLLSLEDKWEELERDLPRAQQSLPDKYFYHGTNALDAASILKNKNFSKSSAFDRLSLSSDLAAAAKFGDVVFVFDAARLQRKGAKKMKYISEEQTKQLSKNYEEFNKYHSEDSKKAKISDIYQYEREWYARLPFNFSDDDLIKIIILKRYDSIENRERIKIYLEQFTKAPIEIYQSASYFRSSKSSSPSELSMPLIDLRNILITGVSHHAFKLIEESRKIADSMDKNSIEFYDFKRDVLSSINYIYRNIQEYDHLFRPDSNFSPELDSSRLKKFFENIEGFVSHLEKIALKNSEYNILVEHASKLLESLKKSIDLSVQAAEGEDESSFYRLLLSKYNSTYHSPFRNKLIKWMEDNINEVSQIIKNEDLRYSNHSAEKYRNIGTFLTNIKNVIDVPADIWKRFPISLLDNDNFYQYPSSKYKEIFENNSESSLLSDSEIKDFILNNRIPYFNQNNKEAAIKLLEVLGYDIEEKLESPEE